MGGSRPPLPPMSAKISICLTTPPPFVSQHQHLVNPPPCHIRFYLNKILSWNVNYTLICPNHTFCREPHNVFNLHTFLSTGKFLFSKVCSPESFQFFCLWSILWERKTKKGPELQKSLIVPWIQIWWFTKFEGVKHFFQEMFHETNKFYSSKVSKFESTKFFKSIWDSKQA